MTLTISAKKEKIYIQTRVAKLFKILTVHMTVHYNLLFPDIITYNEQRNKYTFFIDNSFFLLQPGVAYGQMNFQPENS